MALMKRWKPLKLVANGDPHEHPVEQHTHGGNQTTDADNANEDRRKAGSGESIVQGEIGSRWSRS